MRDVGRSGRTVIFVSHDMQAIASCNRVIWMKGGGSLMTARPRRSSATICTNNLKRIRTVWDEGRRPQEPFGRLQRVRVRNESGETVRHPNLATFVGVEMTYECSTRKRYCLKLSVSHEQGVCILISHDGREWRERRRAEGHLYEHGLGA